MMITNYGTHTSTGMWYAPGYAVDYSSFMVTQKTERTPVSVLNPFATMGMYCTPLMMNAPLLPLDHAAKGSVESTHKVPTGPATTTRNTATFVQSQSVRFISPHGLPPRAHPSKQSV